MPTKIIVTGAAQGIGRAVALRLAVPHTHLALWDTKADGVEISEVLPSIADQMPNLSIIRSLVTNEGSHERGTTFMNTGKQPSPVVQHPAMGAVASSLLAPKQLVRFRVIIRDHRFFQVAVVGNDEFVKGKEATAFLDSFEVTK